MRKILTFFIIIFLEGLVQVHGAFSCRFFFKEKKINSFFFRREKIWDGKTEISRCRRLLRRQLDTNIVQCQSSLRYGRFCTSLHPQKLYGG